MRCSQCGSAAERCDHCGGALCARRLCAELHEAACAVLSVLPAAPAALPTVTFSRPKPRRERNPEAERILAEHLVETIGQHRLAGRAALLAGDLDTAFDELWTARQLEPDLDRLGATARAGLPADFELETDMAPLARALASRQHPRATDAWRRVLDDRPARSIQAEALGRARDLARSSRDQGWLLLAEGDHLAGPLGVRALGRNVRAGCTEPAEEDTFVRIRLAYEGAIDRLPDVAWPWYRLAELLAWAGFAERAEEHLAHAEHRSVGGREAERSARPVLRALVKAGLGSGPDGLPTAARPFPAEPFGQQLGWRLRLR